MELSYHKKYPRAIDSFRINSYNKNQYIKTMNKKNIYDSIIIGSGPAGYTAAMYLSRGNLKTLLFAGATPGGQLMITTDVENYPGFEHGIMGPELMEVMRKQTARFGTEIIDTNVTHVDFSKNPLMVTSGDTLYHAKTVIITTGASAKWLGIESEKRLQGKGISGCATCDGYFFKEKDLIVVGGGDTAMEEALFLTKFAKSIKILVRRDKLRASAIMAERVRNHPKISILFNMEVKEFLGEQKLDGVMVVNNITNEEQVLRVQGAFIAIGHNPNTEIFSGHIVMDELGYIIRRKNSETSVPNVFVAGDVHDRRYRQAVTAAGYGCEAAIDAMKYLEEREEKRDK